MNASYPFDEVRILTPPPQTMTPSEFFALPLAKRVRYVIAKSAVFLSGGIEIDPQHALAQRRLSHAG
jgi:hypothetical protein